MDQSTPSAMLDQYRGPKTIFAQQLHAQKYRSPGETFAGAMRRVAGVLGDEGGHRGRLLDALLDQRFLPAGRVQAAIGSGREVTAFNCFVSGTIPDSFVGRDNPENSSIMDRAREAATTMRMGGGIGYDFSTLRPMGALIKTLQSQSSGPLGFMPVFDAVCRATSSAGNRRGAQMGVLRVDHPDIRAFINAKHDQTTLTGFNMSIAVTDEFMGAVARGGTFDLRWGGERYETVDARELWEEVMRSTWDWGEPGVLFIDTVNRMNNLSYVEKITSCNPCFTGDTLVWTANGHKSFAELAKTGDDVKVLTRRDDGRLVYRIMRKPRVTQRAVKVCRVTLKSTGAAGRKSELTTVRCTPQHVFYLRDGRGVPANELLEGMSIDSAYRHRANSKGYRKIGSQHEHHIPFEDVEGLGHTVDVHHKNEIKWDNRPDNLELMPSAEHDALKMIGSRNPLRRNPDWVHNAHRKITVEVLTPMVEQGLTVDQMAAELGCSRHTVNRRLGRYGHGMNADNLNHKVVSVEYLDEIEDVYCGTVDETHKFFISLGDDHGVLVSNCAEQFLPPFGACNLGSLNLVKYLRLAAPDQGENYLDFEQFEEDVETAVRALDNVTDNTLYPLPEQAAEARSKRRVGLGVTGLANALEACGQRYGTPGFLALQAHVFHRMERAAYLANARLGALKGAFPLYDADRYGVGGYAEGLDEDIKYAIKQAGALRCSHVTSQAPTGTISMTADNVSSSIEPVYRWAQERRVKMAEGDRVEPLYDYGFAELQVRGRRAAFGEVSAAEHLAVLTTAQKYIDSACSKTINCDGSMPWDDFKSIYTRAYEGGAKGCTTFCSDGKRGGLFKIDSEASDLAFPVPPVLANHGDLALGQDDPYNSGQACHYDPATGRRTCE